MTQLEKQHQKSLPTEVFYLERQVFPGVELPPRPRTPVTLKWIDTCLLCIASAGMGMYTYWSMT